MRTIYLSLAFQCFILLIAQAQPFWEPMAGPKGANAVRLAASDDGRVLAWVAGIFKISTDTGETWTDCMEGVPPLAYISDLAATPDGHFFMLLDVYPTDGDELYKLNEAGTGWEFTGMDKVNAISINPQGNIYLHRNGGLWRSDNGGTSFDQLTFFDSIGSVSSLYCLGNNDNYIFTITGLNSDRRLFHFNDDGSEIEELAFPGYDDLHDMAIHPSGNIYQSCFGIFKSSNGVNGWQPLTLEPVSLNNAGVSELTILPSGRIFALQTQAGQVIYSDDEGESWNVVGAPLTGDLNGADILVHGDGHLYYTRPLCRSPRFARSSDSGATWSDLSEKMSAIQVHELQRDFAGNLYIKSCRHPNVEWSSNGGETWSPLVFDGQNQKAERGWVSPQGYVYALTFNRLYRSADSGLSWENITQGLEVSYYSQLFFNLQGEVYLEGDLGIYKSSENGIAWELLPDFIGENLTVSNMAFHPNGDIYMSTHSILGSETTSHSSDGGITWEPLLENHVGFNKVHINNKGDIYFSVIWAGEGVYVSHDNLATYSLSFPTADGEVGFVSNVAGEVFAIIEHDIFTTPDDGITWVPLNEGLKYPYLASQLLVGNDQHLYLANQGDLIYKSHLPTAESNHLSGSVWFDEDGDCLRDSSEQALSAWVLRAQGSGGDYLGLSGQQGAYSMPLAAGDYVVNVLITNALWEPACTSNAPVSFTAPPDSATVDFPMSAATWCPALRVDISAGLLRRCFSNKMYVGYCNEGTAPADGVSVEVTLDSFLIFESASVPVLSQDGQQITFSLGSLGVNQCGGFSIMVTVSCNAAIGQEHCVEAKILPDDCPILPNLPALECRTNVSSFDPNEKLAFVNGRQETEWVLPNTDLEYIVRFQNTGTDTAFHVRIEDRLSFWLDPATVQPGASSHPYTWELEQGNLLRFSFPGIMLPDSNANEAASHGFVKFRISQKPDVPLGNDIRNRASIFFDFNQPIVTNEVVLNVGEPVATKEQAPHGKRLQLEIFPNPSSESATVRVSGTDSVHWTCCLFDGMGRLLRQSKFVGKEIQLDMSELPVGVYFVRVADEDGKLVVGKLMKK